MSRRHAFRPNHWPFGDHADWHTEEQRRERGSDALRAIRWRRALGILVVWFVTISTLILIGTLTSR